MKKKKAFTLVELLVVIAILAILATVSILGYTSFTKKAKQSNCQAELAQVIEMLQANTLDGKVHTWDVDTEESTTTFWIQYSTSDGYLLKSKDSNSDYAVTTELTGDQFKAFLGSDLDALTGVIYVNFDDNGILTSIVYTNSANDAHAKWTWDTTGATYTTGEAYTGE